LRYENSSDRQNAHDRKERDQKDIRTLDRPQLRPEQEDRPSQHQRTGNAGNIQIDRTYCERLWPEDDIRSRWRQQQQCGYGIGNDPYPV